jgi:hypothetical protein
VTTGDASKYLDLWNLRGGDLGFVNRLKGYLAGHTAITEVRDKLYLGTDFSSRPNYIEQLGGSKFFFPKKAYKMEVIAFQSHRDRYIASLNSEMPPLGERKALSIFDTVAEEFIYCRYFEDSVKPNRENLMSHRRLLLAESRHSRVHISR